MNQQQFLPKLSNSIIQSIKRAIASSSQWLRSLNESLGRSGQLFISLFLLGAILTTSLAACSGVSAANQGDVKIKLVSFSVTKAAHDAIIPKFIEKWKKEYNEDVVIERTYGGSLAQTDEVLAGKQEADVVHLALPLDVLRLAEAGLVNRDWQDRFPRRGVLSQSVATIVTRAGNPKKIKDWADLAREDVKVVSADPQTSGIAVWQFLGLWGSITQAGGEPEAAKEFVSKVYKNIPTLVKDARAASDLFFKEKQGDVLVTYENELILAGADRPDTDFFIPPLNISIDNPVAVVSKNVDKHRNRKVVEAFMDFLYSQEAQEEFTKFGYRSVNPFVATTTESKFPPIKTLFNAQDLGGWQLIKKEFFDKGAIFDQIRANPPA